MDPTNTINSDQFGMFVLSFSNDLVVDAITIVNMVQLANDVVIIANIKC